jgi:hypothetical protein
LIACDFMEVAFGLEHSGRHQFTSA